MDTIAYTRDLALAVGRNSSRKSAFTFDASEKITDRIGDVCRPIGDRIRPCWTRVITEFNKFTTSEPAYQIAARFAGDPLSRPAVGHSALQPVAGRNRASP